MSIKHVEKVVAGAVETVAEAKRDKHYQPLISGGLFFAAYFVARALLEMPDLDRTTRIVIAVVPTPIFIWFLWTWMKGIAGLDELQRRIQLEALAFAFPICVVLLMTLGLLELAMPLNPDDWSYRHVWALMPTLYFAGLFRAKRRYE